MAEKLWQFLDAVCLGKADILTDPDFEKEYQPWLINRGLSYHEDAVLAANMMNERAGLDKQLQVFFLINTLRPRKRYAKWIKATVSDDARLVAEYYGCSLRRARELVSLHSSDELTIIRARTDKGGRATKGSRNDSS